MVLLTIIIATIIVSLISLVGVFTLYIKTTNMNKILLFLVALSAGTLMGGAFLHLIPEALSKNPKNVFPYILVGFIFFFLIEKVLHWQHCHEGECTVHTFAYINLLGDFFHNFLDGLIIASSFLVDFRIGLTTTIAIAIHEIPQEIGDYGVLIYAGIPKTRALLLNFLIALTAVAGGIAGFFIAGYIESITTLIISLAAGGFIYIAASDLIPELRKDATAKSLLYLLVFIIGILLMWLLKFIGSV